LCEADDVQDEKHALFHCTHPQMISLRKKYAFLFSQTRFQDVSAFKKKVKVKVYARSHQRALRKGSQLVLTLARAPPKDE
jgi:hypothetical protein